MKSQDALVREAAVDALLALYSQEENISALHGFTERFKGRFAELTNDVSDAVAVKGVGTQHIISPTLTKNFCSCQLTPSCHHQRAS